MFTCVLNSNIRSDDAQWYRFIKDTSTTEMVDPNGENINFLTRTIGNIINSSLTITNARKSDTGYFWVATPSLNVCNASLTVLTSMYIRICIPTYYNIIMCIYNNYYYVHCNIHMYRIWQNVHSFCGFLLYRECFTTNRLASNRHS